MVVSVVCRVVVSVALAKAVLQECCATTFVPMQRLDADKRQVPMRLAWSVVFRPLEDRLGWLPLGAQYVALARKA